MELTLSVLQDALDLVIPLSQADIIVADPLIVGLAGTVTSLLGLRSIWKWTPK